MEEPSVIGRYEIRGVIGRGGMGIVYLAWDPLIGREVALKRLILKEFSEAQAEEIRERFKREAHAAGRLNHPFITTVFDVFEQDGEGYIAMEYVRGGSLDRMLSKDALLPLPEVAKIISAIAQALDHAHDRGIIHRDIKPCNILVPESGGVKITDFGIARIEDSRMTREGAMLGSPSYMSPEQILGREIDRRSDIFSLGVILYIMLTGEKPFPGDSLATLSYRIVQENPTPPSQLVPGLDPSLNQIAARALAKNPEQRFQRAGELDAALNAAVQRIAQARADSTFIPPSDKTKTSYPTLTVMPIEDSIPNLSPDRTFTTPPSSVKSPTSVSVGAMRTPSQIQAAPPDSPQTQSKILLPKAGIIALGVLVAVASIYFLTTKVFKFNGNENSASGTAVASELTEEYKPIGIVPRPYILWRDAQKALKAGDAKPARRLLAELTMLMPDDADAHLALGRAFQADGESKDSLKSYRVALQLDPNLRTDPVLIEVMVSLLGTPRGDEASTILAEVVGDPAENALMKAASDSDSNRWKESNRGKQALETLVKIWRVRLDKNPQDMDTRQKIARALYRLERFDESLVEYAIIIKNRPDSAKEIIVNAVELLDNQRFSDNAAQFLIESVGPPALDKLRKIGADRSPRMQKQAHDVIKTILEKQQAAEPNNAQAAFELAFIYFNEGDLQKSLEKLAAALEKNASLAGDLKVLDILMKAIEQKDAELAKKLLIEKVGQNAVAALQKNAAGENYYTRWNSIAVLDALGALGNIDKIELLSLDLTDSKTNCEQKKNAAKLLVESKDTRAIKILRGVTEIKSVRRCGAGFLDEYINQLEGNPQ